jgi:hypothetical protein
LLNPCVSNDSDDRFLFPSQWGDRKKRSHIRGSYLVYLSYWFIMS